MQLSPHMGRWKWTTVKEVQPCQLLSLATAGFTYLKVSETLLALESYFRGLNITNYPFVLPHQSSTLNNTETKPASHFQLARVLFKTMSGLVDGSLDRATCC